MSDVFPPPPPPTSAGDASSSGGVVLLVASCWGFLAALATGIPVGVVTYVARSATCSTSRDMWCELGALILGALAGIVVALVAYLVVGVLTIVRRRPAGTRAALIAAFLVTPLLAVAVLSVTVGLI